MLMSESLAIGEMLKAAMIDRYGDGRRSTDHFQAFDTICSATQDRQDAVVALLRDAPLDLMIVIGGYNSSNTCNLARICAAARPTFHIADPTAWCRPTRSGTGRSARRTETPTTGWLPRRARHGRPDVGRLHPGQPGGRRRRKLAEFCA